MISKQKVMEQAQIHNLSANTIEKDYVLSWVLAGIAKADKLKNHWVFKGGTCLKKCFFESYRFSEDLDYTITAPTHCNLDFLKSEFLNVSEWIYEQVGIEIPSEGVKFELYENSRGQISIQGKISYKGPILFSSTNT